MAQPSITIRRLEGEEDSQVAFCCQTEVVSPWPQALCRCRDWISANLGKYVDGLHLEDEDGVVVGHLYYALSENALIPYELEPGVGVIYCEWIHQRHQKQGLRMHLFEGFLEEMRRAGAKGVVVESSDLEGQVHHRHYQPLGFEVVHETGHKKLLYLPLTQETIQLHPLTSSIRPRDGSPVEILILNSYLCPFDVSTQELLLDVAQEFGNRVFIRQVQLTPETLREFGAAKGIFINGRQKLPGAETEEAIRQAIMEEL